MHIRNIIFDIGNVVINWEPVSVVKSFFPERNDTILLSAQLFSSTHWIDLNEGKISQDTLLSLYEHELNLDKAILSQLMIKLEESLTLVDKMETLLFDLSDKGYSLFALTNNTIQLMRFLRERYSFWSLFKETVVSAEIGIRKPDPAIFKYLLDKHALNPNETIFIDDHKPNTKIAEELGMNGINFINYSQCLTELEQLTCSCSESLDTAVVNLGIAESKYFGSLE